MKRWRGKNYFWLSVIILLFLIQLPYFGSFRDKIRFAFAPAVALILSPTEKVSQWLSVVGSISSLARENAQLKEELNQTKSQIAFLENLRSENEQLRKDLDFAKTNPQLKLRPAKVISYSPGGFYQALIINKGSNDAVKHGQAVVSSGFLVGVVKNVSKSTSEVWLLSNRNVVIPVVLTNSQTVGLMKGSIKGLVVDNIPLDSQVTLGESVVTSSLEEVIPGGIAVGRVEEVISQKEEIFQGVRVNSPLNSTQLRIVYLVDQ